MLKPFLAAVFFSLVPLSAVAQEQRRADYTGATLQQQQYEIYELNRRLQVQANQREIERLQDRVANGGITPQPQPVIVEQRVNPLVPLIGAAIIGGAIIYNGERYNRFIIDTIITIITVEDTVFVETTKDVTIANYGFRSTISFQREYTKYHSSITRSKGEMSRRWS